jgi:hypothetical protein
LKKALFFILIIYTLISCNYKADKSEKSIGINMQDSSVYHSDSIFVEPLSIDELKSLEFLITTSGVVPDSDAKRLCPKDSVGFFGFYTLINKNTREQIGTLNVHTTEKPENWKYDSRIEKFASITLLNNDVKIWDRAFIGMSKKQVLDFIGHRFHYTKGQTMYSNFGVYDGSFWFTKDTVNKIEIKKTCFKKRRKTGDNNGEHEEPL